MECCKNILNRSWPIKRVQNIVEKVYIYDILYIKPILRQLFNVGLPFLELDKYFTHRFFLP